MVTQPLCVMCLQRPAEDPWRPFCSERCKLEDLARWLDGIYRVPGDQGPQRAVGARWGAERGTPSPDPVSDPDSSSENS